ncbi:hypothetical protein Rhopal_004335-T1 [Rhodotorula paludigena]|uniref:UDP-galactose transporter n=1 Tax=Rhodotorula paludigena TaxID=86838 RepID=A0AAV5GN51_9BASI|nr:hypothetical protein Rhopal_004335-T1 [Rhodotorula paludigena]
MRRRTADKPQEYSGAAAGDAAALPASEVRADKPLVSQRTLALTLLVLQNASVSLLTRLSRTSSGTLYHPAVAVFTAEIVKASLSLFMLARQRTHAAAGKGGKAGYWTQAGRALSDLMQNQKSEQVKLAIPAALYALQNTLLYVALSNLDAATYQTTYQLKLLTTAIFSILFFRRSLSWTKWFSLLLLTLGVAVVQLDSTDLTSSHARLRGSSVAQDPTKGFAAILAACVSSGLAGAWFEWVLKGGSTATPPAGAKDAPPRASPSLWARNLQLAVPSLLFSFAGVLLSKPVRVAYEAGGVQAALHALARSWDGFNALVWAVVLNQALGGLLVAMVVRFADSVAKGFATSLAIVLSTLASALLFGLFPGPLFLLGASLVVLSTVLYSLDR